MANFNSLLACVNTAAVPIANNTALKAFLGTLGTVAYRQGFAGINDGGEATYLWQTASCAHADDGGEVQPAGIGCWILQAPADGISFFVWGAQFGTQVDAPLDASIAWGCRTHIPVLIPMPNIDNNRYLINTTHTIGNGSAHTASTCNGFTLKAPQQYQEFTNGIASHFIWNGASGGVAFRVQGVAQSLNLEGIGVDCSSLCSTGFEIHNTLNSDYGWLAVRGNVGTAFVIDSITPNDFGSGMEGSHFHDFQAGFPSTAGTGMEVGQDICSVCTNAVIFDRFDNITLLYDADTANTFGLLLGLATQLEFTNLRIAPGGVGVSGSMGNSILIHPPSGDPTFPQGITIRNAQLQGAVSDPGGTWAPVVGGIQFDHFGTAQPPYSSAPFYPVSSTYGLYYGVNDRGYQFPGPTSWTPTDASGAGLTLTSTYTKYQKQGNKCTVEFKIVYPTTADGSVAVIGGIPCAPIPGVSLDNGAGGGLAFTDHGTPITVSCTQGFPTCEFYDFAGAGITNAGLSGKTIAGSLTYLAN